MKQWQNVGLCFYPTRVQKAPVQIYMKPLVDILYLQGMNPKNVNDLLTFLSSAIMWPKTPTASRSLWPVAK